jgi:hypothetical protein
MDLQPRNRQIRQVGALFVEKNRAERRSYQLAPVACLG